MYSIDNFLILQNLTEVSLARDIVIKSRRRNRTLHEYQVILQAPLSEPSEVSLTVNIVKKEKKGEIELYNNNKSLYMIASLNPVKLTVPANLIVASSPFH